jgi:hypothetical protein
MSIKRYKPEQILKLLRQIEVEIANGIDLSVSLSRTPSPAQTSPLFI